MVQFLLTAGALAAAISAIGALVLAIYVTAKKPWTVVKRVIKQVDTMNTALGPNGGSSLADEIRKQGKEQIRQGVALHTTAATVAAISDLIEKPVFQTDDKGHWLRVNRQFGLTFGYPVSDMLGLGWVSLIDETDRDLFMRDWDYAIRDRRAFRRQVRVVTRDGVPLVVTIVANPTIGSPEVGLMGLIGWLGVIDIVVIKKPSAPTTGREQ